MGWSSGNDVFDPVCELIIKLVDKNDGIYADDAREILSELIENLQGEDWDTEDESLDKFKDHWYVVKAFEENSIHLEGEDKPDMSEPSHGEWK